MRSRRVWYQIRTEFSLDLHPSQVNRNNTCDWLEQVLVQMHVSRQPALIGIRFIICVAADINVFVNYLVTTFMKRWFSA